MFPVTTLGSCIGACIFRPSSAPAATAVLERIDEMMHDRPPTAANKRQRDGDAHRRESTAPRAAPKPPTSTTTVCNSDSPSNPPDPCCNAAPMTRSVAPATTTATGPAEHLPCLASATAGMPQACTPSVGMATPVRFQYCSRTYRGCLAQTACLSMT